MCVNVNSQLIQAKADDEVAWPGVANTNRSANKFVKFKDLSAVWFDDSNVCHDTRRRIKSIIVTTRLIATNRLTFCIV